MWAASQRTWPDPQGEQKIGFGLEFGRTWWFQPSLRRHSTPTRYVLPKDPTHQNLRTARMTESLAFTVHTRHCVPNVGD